MTSLSYLKVHTVDGFSDLTYVGDSPIYKDELVFELKGEIKSKPTQTSIQIGIDKHIEDSNGIYMNHSCNPTCYIKDEKVYAKKDILSGNSLTFNYGETEETISHKFVCNCCKQTIKGNCE